MTNCKPGYSQTVIYYFSGTGNSRKVASWIEDKARQYSIETTSFNLALIDRLNPPMPPANALVIFISPVHGFNYPPVMLHFIMRFRRGTNPVILMNTRAGMLIGKWITPGLTGITFYLAAAILWLKGYQIKGLIPVDMPSNWVSIHPGLNKHTVEYLHEQNQRRVSHRAERFLHGKKDFRALREIIQDLAIAPISLGYYFVGRFIIAKTFYASHHCNNCGLCVKGCPVKAIRLNQARPYWTLHCESCMKCMGECPRKAIETAHGFILVSVIIIELGLMPVYQHYTTLFLGKTPDGIEGFVINSMLFIAITVGLYRLFHYCLRYRFFERIIYYTSLTHYRWWGKNTKL